MSRNLRGDQDNNWGRDSCDRWARAGGYNGYRVCSYCYCIAGPGLRRNRQQGAQLRGIYYLAWDYYRSSRRHRNKLVRNRKPPAVHCCKGLGVMDTDRRHYRTAVEGIVRLPGTDSRAGHSDGRWSGN